MVITLVGFVNKTPQIQTELADFLAERFSESVRRLDDMRWKEYGLTIGVGLDAAKSVFTALQLEPQFEEDRKHYCRLFIHSQDV